MEIEIVQKNVQSSIGATQEATDKNRRKLTMPRCSHLEKSQFYAAIST
jgi:hypothetical protein